MTFATKKEADAYDKMLDIADRLFDFLDTSDLKLDETQQEELCLLMAEKRDEVMPILRGVVPKKKPVAKQAAKQSGTASQSKTAKAATKPASRAAKKPGSKPKVAAKKA
ncbi:MAG: YebG family protein [Desulfobacterales bacterium]|nr:YebG family protein [Desulfobacterales bacterium]